MGVKFVLAVLLAWEVAAPIWMTVLATSDPRLWGLVVLLGLNVAVQLWLVWYAYRRPRPTLRSTGIPPEEWVNGPQRVGRGI